MKTKLETKVFALPTHPTRGKQKIVVERPEGSVWHLVVTDDKAIPLPALSGKLTAAKVFEAFVAQCGDAASMQFAADGYSQVT